ncbi:MAG TPA: hypothetical protein VHE13_04220 [Opitutus sp.]|nr:hypothetical protein [Opitutus sp.]
MLKITPGKPHLIYLHGAIVAGTNGRPVSPQFGPYEFQQILDRFTSAGFEVLSEIRPGNDVARIAARIGGWVRELKAGGIPANRIALVGASLGGIAAARISHELKDRELSYVLVASLFRVQGLSPVPLSGRVLSIHDQSDKHEWIDDDYFANAPDLAASKVIVTTTGKGHGLLFTPDDAWVLPTLDWLSATSGAQPASEQLRGP